MSPAPQTTPTSRPDAVIAEFRPNSLVTDTPAAEVPAEFWTSMLGFTMRRGYAQRIPGHVSLFGTPLFPPLNVINARTETQNFWVYGGTTGVGVVDQTSTHSDVTPLVYPVAATADILTSALINGFPCLNFGLDPPVFWDRITANVMQPLPDWPVGATCGALRSFKQFLFALNMTESGVNIPEKLRWSSSAEPGTVPAFWSADPTNDAGDNTLSATPGGIVDGLALRDQFWIYKNHSAYSANFTGGTFVFNFQKRFTTSGVLASNCVAEAEGRHVVLTDGDLIIHDGQNIKSLVDRQLRSFIFNQIDPVNFKNSFLLNYRAAKEIWACFPANGQLHPNLAVVWNYAEDLLSVRELQEGWSHMQSGIVLESAVPLTWDTQSGTWDIEGGSWNLAQFTAAFERALAGLPVDTETVPAAHLIFADVGNSNRKDEAINAFIARESLDFGTPEKFKYIRRIWPRLDGTTGTIIRVSVGVQDEPTGGIRWTPAQNFTVNEQDFLDIDVSGRFISVKFEEDTQPGAPIQQSWGVHGFDLEWTIQGGF